MYLIKRTSIIKNMTAVVVVCCLLMACDKNRVFDATTKLEPRSWIQSNILSFDVNIDDTVSYYNMYINVRNTDTYRFSNLYIFLDTKFPRMYVERDTLELNLAAPDGRWLGSGLGDLLYNQILFKPNFKFPQKGVYTFRLQQGMRELDLSGIADVGLRIEKVK